MHNIHKALFQLNEWMLPNTVSGNLFRVTAPLVKKIPGTLK